MPASKRWASSAGTASWRSPARTASCGATRRTRANGSHFARAIDNGNTYHSRSAIQTDEAGATVTGAYVIADGDQAPGVTDVITGPPVGGVDYD